MRKGGKGERGRGKRGREESEGRRDKREGREERKEREVGKGGRSKEERILQHKGQEREYRCEVRCSCMHWPNVHPYHHI